MELVIWPYVAHPEDNRKEQYEWNTSVLEGPQHEQRISFRDIPVFTCSALYELYPNQVNMARLLIEAAFRSNNRLLLPLWSERVFSETPLVGSVSQIFGDFRFVRFDAPAKALVWVSVNESYVVNVTATRPDRIFIEEYIFPDLQGKPILLLPLLEGRIDGDATVGFEENKRHKAQFDFRASVERNYRHRLNICIVLDNSGSMGSGSRVLTLNKALNKYIDQLKTFVESGLIDLSLQVAYCGNDLPVDYFKTYPNLRDADKLEELRTWIAEMEGTGAFVFEQAATTIRDFYESNPIGKNIAVIMTDADDATEVAIADSLEIMGDAIDQDTAPLSYFEGTEVACFMVGIDTLPANLERFSALSNQGPAIRVTGNSLPSFNQIFAKTLFGEDTPLFQYENILDTFEGRAVLSRKSVKQIGASETISRARTGFVTPSGIDWYTDQRIINEVDYMLTFEFLGPSDLQAFLIWMHAVRGKKRSFWLPAQNTDIVLAEDQTLLYQLTIRRGGIDNPYRLLEIPVVQIETVQGDILYRRIVNAAMHPTDKERVTISFDEELPRLYKVRDIMDIHIMRHFRFDTDLVEINHTSMYGTRISLAAKRVPEKFVAPVPVPDPEPEPEE